MVDFLHQADVAIIGAGPVGLFAIFECGMMKLKCHVVDTLDMVGGQCVALYPEKPIYDIPAYPEISAQGLIDKLKMQAEPFEPVYHLGQQVIELQRTTNDRWRLTTSAGTTIVAKVIIIAAGVGAFGPNRPPLENLEEYEGKSVFYYVKNREDFRGKRIIIAGGGDSAIDWALSLSEIAEHVSVVHRRSKFRAAPESMAQLSASAESDKLDLVTPYQLDSLVGKHGQLEAVRVLSMDGEAKVLPADMLLPFYGLVMNLGPIAEWGLGIENKHIVVDPTTMSTNQSGIYAIGDIGTYPHKLKLILTGFAEAAQAAHQARALVYPDEVYHFEYSTTSGVPASS